MPAATCRAVRRATDGWAGVDGAGPVEHYAVLRGPLLRQPLIGAGGWFDGVIALLEHGRSPTEGVSPTSRRACGGHRSVGRAIARATARHPPGPPARAPATAGTPPLLRLSAGLTTTAFVEVGSARRCEDIGALPPDAGRRTRAVVKEFRAEIGGTTGPRRCPRVPRVPTFSLADDGLP